MSIHNLDIKDDTAMAARLETWRKAIEDMGSRLGSRPTAASLLAGLIHHAGQRPRLPAKVQAKAPHQHTEPVSDSPLDLNLREVGVLLRDGRLSAETLTELAVERLGNVHKWTDAVEQLDIESAMSQARCAEAQREAKGAADVNVEAAREASRKEGVLMFQSKWMLPKMRPSEMGSFVLSPKSSQSKFCTKRGLGKSCPPAETSPADWGRIQNANVTLLHTSAQAVLPVTKAAEYGVLLVTGSIAGIGHISYSHLAYSVTRGC